MSGHCDTSGLDLPVRHVRVLQRLDAVLAERHTRAAGGLAVPVWPVLLAVRGSARDEHPSALLASACRGLNRGGSPCAGLIVAGAIAATAAPPRRAPGVGAAGVPVPPLARAQRRLVGLALGPGLRRFALVDPDLDADPAERRAGLVEAVVDVGAQGVQRHAALAVELRPRHFRAAETARALHPDAPGAALHGRLHGLAHGPAERHPAGQLLGHALRDELGVRLGVLHLEDVELDLLAGELLQVAADPVGFGAAPADDDAGPRGVDVHPHPVPGPLDLDLGDARALHAALQHAPDRHVFRDVVLVQLVGVPPALEVGGDT